MNSRKWCRTQSSPSRPAFNVVTGSYDPRSLKSTLLKFKTMWYGIMYTAVPRATVVDRFERSLLGDIQRGLAMRDAAWHNTEPEQQGHVRDIMDMWEYMGMIFGTVGEVSKGMRRSTVRGVAFVAADRGLRASRLRADGRQQRESHRYCSGGGNGCRTGVDVDVVAVAGVAAKASASDGVGRLSLELRFASQATFR
eukprot:jgi/Tetstr1/449797/TSEL_036861.t1